MCAAPGQRGAAPPELFGNLRAWRGDARCPGCCAWPGCSLEGIFSQPQSEEAAAGPCPVTCAPLLSQGRQAESPGASIIEDEQSSLGMNE